MNEKEHDWLRQMFPLAVPWRERARHEATALALPDKGATDAQAAALFAYEVAELRRELAQARADLARPIMVEARDLRTGEAVRYPIGTR